MRVSITIIDFKKGVLLAMIGLLGSLLGCGSDSPLGRRMARYDFKNAFKQAHREQNVSALMDLYYLEGVLPEDRRLLRIAAGDEVVLPLQRVVFTAPDARDRIQYVHDGRNYEATLPVALKMVVRYGTPESYTVAYLLGYQEGRYHLITARPVRNARKKEI